jgi:hypothetical protein
MDVQQGGMCGDVGDGCDFMMVMMTMLMVVMMM